MAEVLTPDCPQCGQPPFGVLGGGTQAFCHTEGCTTLFWNMLKSVDENLMDTSFAELQFRDDGG